VGNGARRKAGSESGVAAARNRKASEMSIFSQFTRHWRFLVALIVIACWTIALFSLKVAFDGMSHLVPPGTALSEADRVALESRSPYTRIYRRKSPGEILLVDRPDGSDDFQYQLVYQGNGIVSEASTSGKWKPQFRLRIAAIAGAVGSVVGFLAWRRTAYPLVVLSTGCAVLFFTTKPFNDDWLVDALKARNPRVPSEVPFAALLPTGLGGRVEANFLQHLDASPSPSFVAWRLEYFLNGYCADAQIHAYAVQTNVRLCRISLCGLVVWQLVAAVRALWIWRSNLPLQAQLASDEGSRGQLRALTRAHREKIAPPWKRRFWVAMSFACMSGLAWRVKLLDDRLAETKGHLLRIVKSSANNVRVMAKLIESGGDIDIGEVLKDSTEREYRMYEDFLTLLSRRGLIEPTEAQKALGLKGE